MPSAAIGQVILGRKGRRVVIDTGAAPAAFATWNPADKSANITLSNGNLTATSSTNAVSGVRSTGSISTGTYRYEFRAAATDSTVAYPRAGFSLSSVSTTGTPSEMNTAGTSGFFENGTVYANGANQGVIQTISPNVWYALEANATTRQFWLQEAGGTRFGPYNLPPTGPLFAHLSINSTVGPVPVTANFGASAWAIPATSSYADWPST